MSRQDRIDEAIAALHEAMLGDLHWPATAKLIDEAFATRGTHLIVMDRHHSRTPPARPEWMFDRLCFGGEPRADLAKLYVEHYYSQDERIPRLVRLPDRRVVHATELFTERELSSSPTFNEALRISDCQNGLDVRMDGPDELDIVMGVADPVAADDWSDEDLDTIEHLLPHVRQFVRVRHALVRAEALGASLTGLLANALVGVIYLDRRGTILEANSRAREVLRQGDGLSDRAGVLSARLASDDARLGALLADALPGTGRQPVSGSMTVEHSLLLPRLVVHVNPLVVHQIGLWRTEGGRAGADRRSGKQARYRRRLGRGDVPAHARREPSGGGAGRGQHGRRDRRGYAPAGEHGAVGCSSRSTRSSASPGGRNWCGWSSPPPVPRSRTRKSEREDPTAADFRNPSDPPHLGGGRHRPPTRMNDSR